MDAKRIQHYGNPASPPFRTSEKPVKMGSIAEVIAAAERAARQRRWDLYYATEQDPQGVDYAMNGGC